jgi:hypothetical protein
MNRILVPALMMFCFLIAPNALADDDARKAKPKTNVKTSGKVIIEVNGERKEYRIGDGDAKSADIESKIDAELDELLKELPDEIRKQIESARKRTKNARNFSFRSFGKGFMIGPDGKLKEFNLGDGNQDFGKEMPKELRERIEKARKEMKGKRDLKWGAMGKAVIIGPDGKRKEIDLDLENGNLGLKELLKGLPDDVRKELDKALEGADKKAIMIDRSKSMKSDDDKLDLILKRLDRMEKQIQELRRKIDD